MSGGRAHLVGVALLDRDVRSGRCGRIDRAGGAGHHERDPGRVRGQSQAVGADLVGHVAVGRHPVAADDHGVDRAGRDQAGRGRVHHQLVRDPHAGQLVDGQAGALEEGPGLGRDRHHQGFALGQLGDHGERGAAPRGGQRARVAVGEDPAGAGGGQEIRAVGGDRGAGGLLLGLDRARLVEGGGSRIDRAGSPHGVAYAVDRGAQIDRGGAGGAEGFAGALEALGRRIARQLECHAVGGRDPDQRRAPDGQAADGLRDLLRAAQRQFALAPGKLGLVDGVEHSVLEAERDDACRVGLDCRHGAMLCSRAPARDRPVIRAFVASASSHLRRVRRASGSGRRRAGRRRADHAAVATSSPA